MAWWCRIGLVVVAAVAGSLMTAPPALAVDCAPPTKTVIPDLPWAQDWLRPERVWPLTQGAGITVAVLDTGVDASVRQLKGRVGPGADLLVSGARADSDCTGHGTFVAGIVAAAVTPGVGFAGLAPQARVLPLRVSVDPGELTAPAALASAIRTAAERGAKVIVVGTPVVRAGAQLLAALDVAMARDALVIVASWHPSQGDAPVDPQVAAQLLSIGGFGPGGAPMTDTGVPVDLLAPGGSLTSIGPRGPGHLVDGGSGYAAAFVAGAAVLVRAQHPQLTAAQVKQRLLTTSDRVARPLPDPTLGHGALDLYAAVTAVLPAERSAYRPADSTAPPAAVGRPQPADDRAYRLALLVAAGAVTVAVGAATVALLAPKARRRRWRPARR